MGRGKTPGKSRCGGDAGQGEMAVQCDGDEGRLAVAAVCVWGEAS